MAADVVAADAVAADVVDIDIIAAYFKSDLVWTPILCEAAYDCWLQLKCFVDVCQVKHLHAFNLLLLVDELAWTSLGVGQLCREAWCCRAAPAAALLLQKVHSSCSLCGRADFGRCLSLCADLS